MRLITIPCLLLALVHHAIAQPILAVEHARDLTADEQTIFENFAKNYLSNQASFRKSHVHFTQRIGFISMPVTHQQKSDHLKSTKWLIQHDKLITPNFAYLTESGPSWAYNNRLFIETGNVQINYHVRRRDVALTSQSRSYDHHEALIGFSTLEATLKGALSGKLTIQLSQPDDQHPTYLIGDHLLAEFDSSSTGWMPLKLLWTSLDHFTPDTKEFVCKELTNIETMTGTGRPLFTVPAGSIATFGYGPRQLLSDVHVYPETISRLPNRFANASVNWKNPGDVMFLVYYYRGAVTVTIATLILVAIATIYLVCMYAKKKEALLNLETVAKS